MTVLYFRPLGGLLTQLLEALVVLQQARFMGPADPINLAMAIAFEGELGDIRARISEPRPLGLLVEGRKPFKRVGVMVLKILELRIESLERNLQRAFVLPSDLDQKLLA